METNFVGGKLINTFSENVQVIVDFVNYRIDEIENGKTINEIDMRGDFSVMDYELLLNRTEFRESYWTTCKQVEEVLSDADRAEFYRVFTKVIDPTVEATEQAISQGHGFIKGLIVENSFKPD